MLLFNEEKRLRKILTLLLAVALTAGLLVGCGDGSGGGGDVPTNPDQAWLPSYPTPAAGDNETMMQAFFWEMKSNGDHWSLLEGKAKFLSDIGITSLWLPPASKAWGGIGSSTISSVGYDVYDLWDLGQYNQKGAVRTKYGTKKQLISAMKALQGRGVKVYFDAVFNHRMGADSYENVNSGGSVIGAWTSFTFPGRSTNPDGTPKVQWNWNFFDAVDYDQNNNRGGTFLFDSKTWDNTLDKDYLMGCDVDYNNNTLAKNDVINWGKWILNDIGEGAHFDGFRLDAIKHIDDTFMKEWIDAVSVTNSDAFFVGEVWEGSMSRIKEYIGRVNQPKLHLFDFPLYYTFLNSFGNGNIGTMLETAGLVNDPTDGSRAVMFADNHDTNRDGDSPGMVNYKLQAYTYMLTREEGIPCIYWRDFYQYGMGAGLQRLLVARKHFAYGTGCEVNETDSNNVYAYVRDGSTTPAEGDGLIMLIAKEGTGTYQQNINSGQPSTTFYDITGNITEEVTTDASGYGIFKVLRNEAKGWSVWVPKL